MAPIFRRGEAQSLMSAVTIRTDITFARLVYEHLNFPQDRSHTAWVANRGQLNRMIRNLRDWRDHRLVYIERCRLKPAADRSAAP
jgi:hypothetical protein